MASQRQALWPVSWPASWALFHGPVPLELAVPCVQYSGCECVGVPSAIPHYCNTVTANYNAKDNRRFLLERSVFDLVDSHLYLSLTDPKLLGWYLRLSQEDRKLIQDEGGFHQFLLRHPALELSGYHVYVKYNIRGTSPAKPAMISQNQSGGKKTCTCEEELRKLPSPVREALSLLSCCSDMDEPASQQHSHEQLVQLQDSFQSAFSYHSSQDSNQLKAKKGPSLFELDEERASWKMTSSSSSALCKDSAAPGSFSADMVPQRLRQEEKPEVWSRLEMTESQSANLLYPEASASESDWSALEHDSSKYYSFDSKLGKLEELMSKAGSLDHLVHSKEGAAGDKEAILSCMESNSSSSVMKDDHSILAAIVPREERRTETSTSTSPPVTKCDVMVGTEPAQCRSAFTNTEAPGSSDKHVITEVHMADLDYFTEEFIKLKKAEEELKELKEKLKSPGCKWRKESEFVQRAQQAELGLLTLQYTMCKQHCWRLYCTFAEGDCLTQGPKNPPANILSVEQQLESDFLQMRTEILAGVPLKQLKPLSVDYGRVISGGQYVPAQIIADVLGNVSHTLQTPGHESGCAGGSSGTSSQRKHGESSKVKRAVALLLQDKNRIPHAQRKLEETQTAACKELSSSEAWYDAEEVLQPETGRDATQNDPSGGSQNQALDSTSPPKATQVDQKPQSSSSRPSNPERKLVSEPPLSFSIGNRKVISTLLPTGSTCVPQYYCTMGGFDRLMSELKQRHPEVSRQKIVDALVSLRAKHHGVLSGLPLSAIRDMTSELLTSQHSDVETPL
ncbi:RNA-binding protein 44 isoform X2 [Halichoeres trimaculatus]|uniref:RNA-binding protein 44 isoform X2 n=1 Tax=Halichoeres trimaculatus TaxID=147232 RepID=UPI003D9E7BCC